MLLKDREKERHQRLTSGQPLPLKSIAFRERTCVCMCIGWCEPHVSRISPKKNAKIWLFNEVEHLYELNRMNIYIKKKHKTATRKLCESLDTQKKNKYARFEKETHILLKYVNSHKKWIVYNQAKNNNNNNNTEPEEIKSEGMNDKRRKKMKKRLHSISLEVSTDHQYTNTFAIRCRNARGKKRTLYI